MKKTWEALNNLETDVSNHAINIYEKYYLPVGEYSRSKTNKEYVFIHHTAGWENPYRTIDHWG